MKKNEYHILMFYYPVIDLARLLSTDWNYNYDVCKTVQINQK